MAVMTRPWSLDKLAAVSGEPEPSLQRLADSGLLHKQADGDFEPDSLHRMRLIQFARSRGVDEQQLAAAASHQGDLLGIFEELHPASGAAANLYTEEAAAALDAFRSAQEWGTTVPGYVDARVIERLWSRLKEKGLDDEIRRKMLPAPRERK